MNKLITMGFGAMLVILVIASAMIPVTTEFSKNIYSYEENENVRYALSDDNDRVEITTTGGIAKINSQPLSELLNSGNQLFMFGDTFIVMYTPTTETTTEAISFFDAASGTSKTGVTKAIFDDKEFQITGTDANSEAFTYSGTYTYAFHASEHGNYCAASGPIIAPDAKVYIVRAVENSTFGVYSGTYDNLEKVFYSSGDLTCEISTEMASSDPDTLKITGITGVTGKFNLIVPLEYPHVSNMDQITRMMVTLSPLFLGLSLFAAMGVYLVRMTKN